MDLVGGAAEGASMKGGPTDPPNCADGFAVNSVYWLQ